MKFRTALIAVCAALIGAAGTVCAGASGAAQYRWNNVKIGGGGYIPNILFSPIDKGVAYLRSDMGGVYRWDQKAKRWIGLQDGDPQWNYRGVESVALDPKDPDTLYAAVGAYRRLPAAILRTHDKGAHWQATKVPFRMGGNEEGRDAGERLAVDPADPAHLYFGSRYDGLQESRNGGKSWHQVASFPLKGLGAPPDGSRPHAGLSFVLFDPAGGKTKTGTKTIYVGGADPGAHHLYVSRDGGKSWSAVSGGPDADLLPLQAALDGRNHLYLTYADNMGPWDVHRGGVWRLDTQNGQWTDISPDADHPAFSGLGLDARHPGTLVVASLYRTGGDSVWHSTDYGKSWTSLKDISRRDVSETPFLKWGAPEANFGWWITGLAIDPFDSGRIVYTTGATIYASDDLGKAEMVWKPWVEGVEQTAILALASPPAGPHLLSGIGDIGGFTHFDLAKSPALQEHPIFTNTNTVDYAEKAPNVIVRSGTYHYNGPDFRNASLAWSKDGGKSWQPLYAPYPEGYAPPKAPGYNYGDAYVDAAIAVSADGRTFVVMTHGPVLTRDDGKSWQHIAGLGKKGRPVADRNDPARFYAVDFAHSRILVSTDGAAHFAAQDTVGLPKDIRLDEPGAKPRLADETPPREMSWPLMAAPGRTGDLWYLTNGALYHSRDGGRHFAHVEGNLTIKQLAFGKSPAGKTFPALFALGTRGGVFAVWRSDDEGKSWLRINDAGHEYARTFRAIAADKRVFGRVYVGTDGRGIVYGEPAE